MQWKADDTFKVPSGIGVIVYDRRVRDGAQPPEFGKRELNTKPRVPISDYVFQRKGGP